MPVETAVIAFHARNVHIPTAHALVPISDRLDESRKTSSARANVCPEIVRNSRRSRGEVFQNALKRILESGAILSETATASLEAPSNADAAEKEQSVQM